MSLLFLLLLLMQKKTPFWYKRNREKRKKLEKRVTFEKKKKKIRGTLFFFFSNKKSFRPSPQVPPPPLGAGLPFSENHKRDRKIECFTIKNQMLPPWPCLELCLADCFSVWQPCLPPPPSFLPAYQRTCACLLFFCQKKWRSPLIFSSSFESPLFVSMSLPPPSRLFKKKSGCFFLSFFFQSSSCVGSSLAPRKPCLPLGWSE